MSVVPVSMEEFDGPLGDADFDAFAQIRCRELGEILAEVLENSDFDDWTFEALLRYSLHRFMASRHRRSVEKVIRAARFHNPDASLERIRYTDRGVGKRCIDRLAYCEWVKDGRNILLVGETGRGKSYLAQALGICAAHKGYKPKFYSIPELAYRVLTLDPKEYQSLTEEMTKCDVLILDDLGLVELSKPIVDLLTAVIQLRAEHRSTIVTSQYPVKEWHRLAPELTAQMQAVSRRLQDLAEIVVLTGNMQRSDQSYK